MKKRILLFEKDTESRTRIATSLTEEEGYAVCEAKDLLEAERLLCDNDFDAVVCSIGAQSSGNFSFLDSVRRRDPYLPIIALASETEIALAVEAMRRGAEDVLPKPVDLSPLARALKRAFAGETRRHCQVLKNRRRSGSFFVAKSDAADRLMESALRAAEDRRPLLINGETGTGKGLLARWIHEQGERACRRFAEVNCSGLRSEILALELFGPHSWTGDRGRKGHFYETGSGTLFLDEIGDMAPEMQRRLLAALKEERGAEAPRLISSSNRDLPELVRQGLFERELYLAIKVVQLRIPPLRERIEELPALVRHLLSLSGATVTIAPGALTLLKGYGWPGNVQELKSALEQGVLLSRGERLEREHFSWLFGSRRRTHYAPLGAKESPQAPF